MNEDQAKERIEELKGYYAHLTAYVAANLFLAAVNLLTGPGFLWFLFPLMGWGIGLAIHTAQVFWTGRDWESRKMEQLTGLKTTRDELHKLAERTEALVTIMSTVNWDKIDPALLDTRENLKKAREKIARLKDRDDPESRAEVKREIEKLEAFVTSSRFGYYELAAEQKPPN